MYTTRDSQKVDVICYREKVSATTAYVKVAKATVVQDGCTNFIKGESHWTVKKFQEGGVLQDLEEIEDLDVIELKLDKVERNLRFPVTNREKATGSDLKLKKGKILAEIREIEESIEEEDIPIAAVGK